VHLSVPSRGDLATPVTVILAWDRSGTGALQVDKWEEGDLLLIVRFHDGETGLEALVIGPLGRVAWVWADLVRGV